ncbi:maleylpyruvate isomerase family mycothiol-dependent enzyme [Arthrobacter mangrovi]|uniref:maleylpyruvate isomerase family mycothiol-dependent enzyme n=1 Tax=Arthrobacter mangrovi TaxID=2966350 RepID=UPI00222F4E25|nr:maleylpyruvate isomerase family mycothiol-dependent enzyme [Arthrobacter mangrovi]
MSRKRNPGAGIWTVVHDERTALVRDLEALPADKWATPSLCPGWDVHDVLAHLVDDAKTTRLGFVRRFIAAGFDFDRCNAQGVARERAKDPFGTLDAFRAAVRRTTSAPAPPATRLVEVFVHGEDIRRPLGLARSYPASHVASALAYQAATSMKLGGGKERTEGLRLEATDTEFGTGAGKLVRGTASALLLAVSGRPLDTHELAGPGTAALLA